MGTRRRNDVDATSLRRIDVVTTSCACWELGPPLAPQYSKPWPPQYSKPSYAYDHIEYRESFDFHRSRSFFDFWQSSLIFQQRQTSSHPNQLLRFDQNFTWSFHGPRKRTYTRIDVGRWPTWPSKVIKSK